MKTYNKMIYYNMFQN